jgi:hypothetical protein
VFAIADGSRLGVALEFIAGVFIILRKMLSKRAVWRDSRYKLQGD